MVAENAELRSQHMTLKEMAVELFIKCKLLSEQKDEYQTPTSPYKKRELSNENKSGPSVKKNGRKLLKHSPSITSNLSSSKPRKQRALKPLMDYSQRIFRPRSMA